MTDGLTHLEVCFSMTNKWLLGIEYTSLFAGLTMTNIQNIFSLIMMVVSVLIGLVNLVLVIKKALADGKVDAQEEAEILESINKLQEAITEGVNNNDKSN